MVFPWTQNTGLSGERDVLDNIGTIPYWVQCVYFSLHCSSSFITSKSVLHARQNFCRISNGMRCRQVDSGLSTLYQAEKKKKLSFYLLVNVFKAWEVEEDESF